MAKAEELEERAAAQRGSFRRQGGDGAPVQQQQLLQALGLGGQ